MSFDTKVQVSTSNFEVDSHDQFCQKQQKQVRMADSARVSLTILALLCGLTTLGTSGHTLTVYNATHLASDFNLPLWPEHFDLRPSITLVVGSAIVVLTNMVSLLFSKVQMLRDRTLIHTSLTFVAPFVGFAAVMTSMIFFYAVNASTTVDTLQGWSCRWDYAGMSTKPYFGTLCKESQTALYLSVSLVPLELIVLTIAAYQMVLERKASALIPSRKTSSPALS
ncbi:Uu.00g080350.m01.CDS01 [Anthostomella pinea]|uniref:Uu.00g080350.m01.CDS01 n=1 Tax=Anthostomella pinea TaxID=933095 RepID=A0AAI8VKY3_9PEZI|nr:Uu.00g080350.m01.CDS01 [Anthostomella pinea]